MGYTKEQLLARLEELQIDFKCYEHPVVLTVEAQAKYVGHLGGQLSKSLLLKDKKHRFYVISALANTNVDLKVLSQRLGLGKGGLRMAPEEALQEILQVPLGCVTPFALINDSASAVSLMLDQGLRTQEYCYFHPLTNDMTISINASGLEKFLVSIGKQPAYVDLEANPVVGKDSPPDLASLVPSDAPTLPNSAEKVLSNSLPVQNNVPAPKMSAGPAGKGSNQSSIPKRAPGKTEKTVDPLVEATNIQKLVNEIVNKISTNFLPEIIKTSNEKQDVIEPSVVDKIGKHISSDLEHMLMTLKNAAYTQGFQAASQANKRRF